MAAVDLADDGLPSLSGVVRIDGQPVRFLGLHTRWPVLPWLARSRDDALRRVAEIARTEDLPVVALGDLNLSPDAPAFGRLLGESGLRDVMHGPDWRPTWRASFWPLALRIDHVLVNGDLCVDHAEVGAPIGSDHRPVMARLQAAARRGRGGDAGPGRPGHLTGRTYSAGSVSPVGGGNSRQQSTSQARKRTTLGSENCSGGAARYHAPCCCTLGIIGRTSRPAARSAATSDQRASATPLPCSTAASVTEASSGCGSVSVRVVSPPTRRSQSRPRLGAAVQQRVAGEVRQRVDRAEACEQRRAADGKHPLVQQVLGPQARPLTRAVDDGGVEIVAAEVERRPGRAEAHLDLRMPAVELAEARQQPALQELVRDAQVEQSTDSLATDAVHCASQFLEPAPHAGQQLGAFLREGDRAGVAPEQRHADVGLQRLDLRAHGGRRHAEFPRGGGEAQVGRDGLEDAQRVQRQTIGDGGHRTPRLNFRLTIRIAAPACKAATAWLWRESEKRREPRIS